MKTKNYLPPVAYRIGAIGTALQICITLGAATVTSPSFRGTHLGLAALYLGMMAFWLHMHGKAKRAMPVKPTKVSSVPAALGFLRLMVVLAVGLEVGALWMGYQLIQSYQQVPSIHSLRTLMGTVFSILGMQVNMLMGGGMMITVARHQLDQAKAAAREAQTVGQEEVVAPTRATWWTQDETRQELRRK